MKNELQFEQIYKDYYHFVYKNCIKIVGIDLAEDMTQETFIHIFNHLDKFEGKAKLATWIYRIAVNTCYIHLRKITSTKRKTDLYPVSLDDNIEHHPKLNYPFEEKLSVLKIVKSLSPKAKLHVILYCIEGYEHNEIAKILNEKIATSKSHIHRARQTMLRKLGKWDLSQRRKFSA